MSKKYTSPKWILFLSLFAVIILISMQVLPRVTAWATISNKIAKSPRQKIVGMKTEVSIALSATNNPRISLADGHEVLTEYIGSQQAVDILTNNQAEPLALTTEDFDRDGVKDVVAAYGANGNGILTLYRGNIDWLYPNAPEAKKRKAAGENIDAPFLPQAQVFEISTTPDFIGTGDFNADGNRDLVIASRHDNALLFLTGDGKGNFSSPTRVNLPGFITALRCGDVNRRDGMQDVVVGIWSGDGAKVMVFESPEGAMKAKPEIFNLSAQITDLLIEELDGDYPTDMAVASGKDLLIISGRDRKLSLSAGEQAQVEPAKISRQRFRANIRSLAFGDFNKETGRELALLTDDGSIEIIARASGEGAAAIYTSRNLETGVFATATQLFSTRVSDEQTNNLAVLDGAKRQLHLISSGVQKDSRKKNKENLIYDAGAVAEFNLTDEPVAVLPARLNSDPLSDFVFLRRGQSAITVAPSAPKTIFTVTNTLDDNNTGSLRRAINDANGNFGFDEIDFMVGSGQQTINLSAQLPDLQAIFLNGTSQPGYAGQPLIAINGASAGTVVAGLVQTTTGEIQGIVVQNMQGSFPNGNGIQITSGAGEATIHNCYIGTNFDGTAAAANGGVGIDVEGASTVLIGGTSSADLNLVSSNTSGGIRVAAGASDVSINGNFIGTNLNGSDVIANGGAGVRITASTNNFIDGTVGGFNLISGNTGNGVTVDSASTGNVIIGNRIGTNSGGSTDLGNSFSGIAIAGSNSNTIGGTQGGQGNTISGNNASGISVSGDAANTVIEGNLIGTDAEANVALGNSNAGVLLFSGATNTSIGGTTFGTGNTISGNNIGVQIGNAGSPANGNFVRNNKIGINGSGSLALPNATIGVHVLDSSTNTVGDSSGGGNIISGNGTFGILIARQSATASTNTVVGNLIGTDSFVSSAIPNGSDGIRIDNATNNQIGDTTGVINVISGNTGNGVSIVNGAANNTVLGNFIGIIIPSANSPRRLSFALPNANGVLIQNSPNNTIGGSTLGAGNIISGNTTEGVFISGSSSTGNLIQGNTIGLDDVGVAAANGVDGVSISGSASNNTIGGTAANAGNTISGNGGRGIFIGASGNFVQGNLIGTNITGTSAIANPVGVVLFSGATNNTIGGTTTAARNIISGNSGDGILIQGSGVTGNLIQGNYIGTDIAGTAAIPNNTGITIDQGASNNTVGGTSAGARNIISGNTGNGILIQSTGTTGNSIQGNYIGLKADGSGALPNLIGVFMQSGTTGNTVGGTASGAGNVISGNLGSGVSINNTDVSGNLIQGNFIGTDPAGATAIGNDSGVRITDSPSNTIGGTSTAARNIISGNTNNGILLLFADSNIIQGNFIGTNASGNAAIGNGAVGIRIFDGNSNTIGGAVAGAANVISGNLSDGVNIGNGKSLPNANSVKGNIIGTNLAGTAAIANGGNGVVLDNTANTMIGGTTATERNIISGNTQNGITFIDSTSTTLIQGNFIGTNAAGTSAIANGVDGVRVNIGSSNNVIGGTTAGTINLIAFNTGRGVNILSGTGNQILGNSIFTNGSLGIDLGNDGITPNDSGDGDTGPNNLQNFPVLTAATSGGGSIMISGTLNSTANSNFRIEFFLNTSCDSSGNGEGQTFLGFTNVTTDGSGSVTFNATVPGSIPAGNVVTATATDSAGNTSEFSQCQGATAADADLSVTKSGTPDPVIAGNNITYTVTVNNAGPVAAANASLTDVVPTNTTFQSINAPAGWTVSAPPVGGTGTIMATNPSVAVSSPQVFTIVVKVNANTANGSVINNTANISSSTNDPNPNNNSASAQTMVTVQADLSVTKTDAPDPVIAGMNITYTVTVTNNGPSNAASVSLAESTPVNTTFQSLNAPAGWSCSTPPVNGTGNITCTNSNLAPGTPQVFTLIVQVNIGTPNGTVINNSASVSATTPDPNSSNNSASTTTTVNNTCSISCPANIAVSTAPNQCNAVVNYPAPTVGGSCGTVTCVPTSGSTFPKGTTTVTCTTQAGPSCTFTITVNDTQAPTITCPGNISVVENPPGSGTAQVNYAAPTVSDNCPGVGSPSCIPPSGSLFPLGTTTVTCNVSDSSENGANCSFQITVNNTCSISCPSTITVTAPSNQCSATVNYPNPTVTGNCGTVTCKPSSGAFFAVGSTRVNCTTTQGPSCSFDVVVLDRTPPQISCPGNITAPLTGGQAGSIVNYPSPTISDNCSGVRSFCTPASGTAFPVGTTTVTCTATDNTGNARSCTFTVTIFPDTVPPTITCPQNVTVQAATGETTAVVTYPAPTVTDNNPGATAVCVPPSGSTFALGTTPVTCTATDVGGNHATCSFSVIVEGGPPQGVVSIPGGKSNVEFPTSPARRKAKPGACSNFSIMNTGQTPLILTFESILRTGADVTSGRITDPNEGDLYRLSRFNSNGTEIDVPLGGRVTIGVGEKVDFCARLVPRLPQVATGATGLAAPFVLPDVITSRVTFRLSSGSAITVNLLANIATEFSFINPNNTKKAPQAILERQGDNYVLTYSIFDSNLDVKSSRVELLDNNGTVLATFDVDLQQPLRDRNLVRGQSFTVEQRFTGANANPGVTSARVTVMDGATSATLTASLSSSGTALRINDSNRAIVRLPILRIRK